MEYREDCGVGIFLEESEDVEGLVVSEVFDGGPAQGRLKEGDILRALVDSTNNWIPTAGLNAQQAAKLILGPRGTSITLIVERKHHQIPAQRHSVTITRGSATSGPSQPWPVIEPDWDASIGVTSTQNGKLILPEPSDFEEGPPWETPEHNHKRLTDQLAAGRPSADAMTLMAQQLRWTSQKLEVSMSELHRTSEKLKLRDQEAVHYKRRCAELEGEVERLERTRRDIQLVKEELDTVKQKVAGAHEEVLKQHEEQMRELLDRNNELESLVLRYEQEKQDLQRTSVQQADRSHELEELLTVVREEVSNTHGEFRVLINAEQRERNIQELDMRHLALRQVKAIKAEKEVSELRETLALERDALTQCRATLRSLRATHVQQQPRAQQAQTLRKDQGVSEGGIWGDGKEDMIQMNEMNGDVGRDVCVVLMRAYAAMSMSDDNEARTLVQRLSEFATCEDRHECVMGMLALACLCLHPRTTAQAVCTPLILERALSLLSSTGARSRRYAALLLCNTARMQAARTALCRHHASHLAVVLRATADTDKFAAVYASHTILALLSDETCAAILISSAGGHQHAYAQLSHTAQSTTHNAVKNLVIEALTLVAPASHAMNGRQ